MPKIDIVNAKNIIESNPEKAFFKLKNTGGPKGDTGAQGPQGPKGDTGAQGPAGASASVTVGSTTTLSPGADATVTNSGDTRNAILNFGIPTGAQGPQGIQGPKGDTGPMGQTGAKGDTGAAATVQVGNTNTGAPGTNAQVTNAGNEHFAVFNFTIPRGDKGEKGATGAQGAKGDKGDKGDAGTAATITVGSTTTTNPGTNATVTNSGTTSAAVLNFGIPRGATGSVKSDVVSELPETGEEDTFYLVNREATEQTATGKAINFTNSDNAGDITDFKLDGETSQNGTPTPDAPVAVNTTTGENVVKICGKNLANYIPNTTLPNGVSLSVDSNGVYTLNGTCTANGTFSVGLNNVLPIGSSKTMSFNILSGSMTGSNSIRYRIRNRNGIYSGVPDIAEIVVSSNSTGTLAKTITNELATLNIFVAEGAVYSDYKFALQLELGSTATAYEPYQSQSYEVNLGKNLFDKDKTLDDYYYNNSGTTTSDGVNKFVNQEFNGITKMAISWSSRSGASAYVRVCEYKADGTFIKRTLVSTNNTILTMDANTWKVITCVDAGPNFSFTDLQIERGDSVTDYAAYFTPIELCKIGDYQDYIYKSGGKWYVHNETGVLAVDTSTITSSGTAYSNIVYGQVLKNDDAKNKGAYTHYVGLCSHAIWSGNASNWNSADNAGKCYDAANGSRYWIGFASGTSLEDIKTALSGCEIVYPLATPTDTEITNQALIAQLDNVASAPLYTGVNNITTITPNEQGTLEIKYVTYDKYNQNKVYIWNDTLQQWQIIVP